ncbi:DUF7935 family protein [Flavobacterium restrictum]|uniref:Uncharacterized protein n=1 Tax=Flavobacterium restrictum TaxID=2594428 RepID=A0A553DXJ7_9FLAO|nr:hypothetical protein [Flavobacterium restrictum]TRX37491.1 hypothetical protein FNW21_11950 [Flavobacterium restrictum]
MENKFIEILAYTIPSIVTGSVAYYLFASYFKEQQNNRRWLLQKDAQKEALPLRLQAYERMTLFLERISLTKLLIRISPITADKKDYGTMLIDHIEQELEHNLTQQIYLSDDCWSIIVTAKNATIQMIRRAIVTPEITTADQLRELLLNDLLDKQSPSNAALSYIKNEVSQLW